MAGDWVKVELVTADKPEVLRIARLLDIDKDAAFGKLIRLWAWFDQNSVDGVVDGVVDADIDTLCHQPGFAKSVESVGWLFFNRETEQAILPNFDRHNGETAKKRALKNKRQAKWRQNRDAQVDGNVDTSASTNATTREEKRRYNTLSIANPLCDDVIVGSFPDITELPKWLHDQIVVAGVTPEYIQHTWPIVASKLKEQPIPQSAKIWANKIVTYMVRGYRNGWDTPPENKPHGNKRQSPSRTQRVVDELDRLAKEDIEKNGFANTLGR